jgi:TetR/AcrR family transcriptional regulator, cholesterol catabolism regulator
VLWALVSGAAAQFFAAARPIIAADLPPTDRLRALIAAHVGVVAGQADRALVFLNDWKFLSPPRWEAIAAQRDEYEGLFRATIADGIAAGDFASADLKIAATLILSALNGIPVWYRPEGVLSAEEIAARYADLLLAGLQRRPAEQPGLDSAGGTTSR